MNSSHTPSLLLALALVASPAEAQRAERDLAYGPDPRQVLDLTVPARSGVGTVLFVHGGSLTSGDKSDEDYRGVCAPFARDGLACASMNYRLAPAHPWPRQAEDVASAIAWLRKALPERGGDPDRLFLVGHSSGATLVALIASDPRYLAAHGLTSSVLRGVVPMGSIMWDDELVQAIARRGRAVVEAAFRRDQDNAMYPSLEAYEDRWPMRHVRAGMPPLLLLVAEEEQEQPPVLRTNRAFADSARQLGNHAEVQVLPGRDHYGAVHRLGEPGDAGFRLIREFVRRFSAGRP